VFYLGKLVDSVLLPPGIFILMLLIGAIYAWRFRAILVLSVIAFYMLSIRPVSNALLEQLESFSANETNSPQVVVALSGGTKSSGPFKAYPDGFKRELYALMLAKEQNLPLLFSGGGIGLKEANQTKEDVALLERSFGFDVQDFYEPYSLNTWQNAKFSAKYFNEQGWGKDILLVTSAYHAKRATLMFKNFGFRVTTKSTGYLQDNKDDSFGYLPRMRYLSNSYKALHEYVGLIYFAFKQIFD